MYKKNLLISLLLFLSSSSQLVLADIYKCVSSKGEISYTEKRCDDGAVSKKGRWHSLKKREKILYEKFEEEIKLAEINGMSEEDLRLLDATLNLDSKDLSGLGYDYSKWGKIVRLIELRLSSLEAAKDSMANNQEMSRDESLYYSLHQSAELNERVDKKVRRMQKVLVVAQKYIVEEVAIKAAIVRKKAVKERVEKKRTAAAYKEVRGDSEVSHADAVWIGKQAVKGLLKDSGSAKFRGIEYVRFKSGGFICGEVNSKNSFGGFSGWQHFISAGTQTAYLEEQVSGFRGIWRDYCRGKAW